MPDNAERINDDSEPNAIADSPPAEAVITYRMVGSMAPLFAAKAKARLEFKPIVKNREVEVQPKKRDDGSWPAKYKFTYATLDSVRDSCDEALARNGLDVFHLPCTGLDARELHTFLTHSSGAFIEAVLLIPDVKGWQDFGSAMTYAERYSYQALVGVASEHDDDGNAADGNQVQNSQPRQPRSTPAAPPAPKTGGKPANGSAAQPSKPVDKSQPAPTKPQDAPAPKSEPPPAQAEETPPAAAQEPPTPLQRKTLGDLCRWPGFKITGQLAKSLVERVSGKDHTQMVGPDYQLVIDFLEAAKRLETYDAPALLAYVDEQGSGEQAAKAMKAEADAFLGGA